MAFSQAIAHLAALVTLITMPGMSLAVRWTWRPDLARDGAVRFYAYHLDEFAEIRYAENGRWLPEAEKKLQKLFRSRGDGAEFPFDRRLVELCDHLQDRFGADTIEVISAYRSPAFNKSLKDAGHNVANESLHTKGLAMDIHIDEIAEDTLRDYLVSLRLGGVGYYGNKLMVHMDFGPVRTWRDGGFVENTGIGEFNPGSPVRLSTDRLFYPADNRTENASSVTVAMSISGEKTANSDIYLLEKFRRGKWLKLTALTPAFDVGGNAALVLDAATLSGKLSPPSSHGKYRIHRVSRQGWQNSNEFYVKKK